MKKPNSKLRTTKRDIVWREEETRGAWKMSKNNGNDEICHYDSPLFRWRMNVKQQSIFIE
jgi:hypothetical protein